MNASNEDGESVDSFLERIASLKDRRDREDEERTRKLEADILQGRRERQARRAERARSLSPPKNVQPTVSSSSLDSTCYGSSPEHAAHPPVNFSPSSQLPAMEQFDQRDPMKASTRGETSPTLPSSPSKSSARSSTNATTVSRSNTLSWQQRPPSRDSNSSRSRPQPHRLGEAISASTEAIEEERTRDQIALSLESKDPSWFRQTADRGISSSAYRKNKDEGEVGTGCISRQLPGISRGPIAEPERLPLSSSSIERSRSPSQTSHAHHNSSWGNRFSSMSSQSTIGGLKSPLPAISQQKFALPIDGPDHDQSSNKRSAFSPSQSQPSRDRPPSPTKGLGGFVQSAMMKRSDSVSKRWSAQAAPGLSRGNSVASYRGGVGYSGPSKEREASPPPDTIAGSRGPASSPMAKSRPTSSHSTSTVLHHAESTNQSSIPEKVSSAMAQHSAHLPSLKSNRPSEDGAEEREDNPKPSALRSPDVLPVSPTKTMDQKRWSPTKASWLESALARPESPKLPSPKAQTPSWMADLQKSRLSKENSESLKSPASGFGMVSPVSLTKPPSADEQVRPLSVSGRPRDGSLHSPSKLSPEKSQAATVEEKVTEQPVSADHAKETSNFPAMPSFSHLRSVDVKDGLRTKERKELPVSTTKVEDKSPPSKKKPLTPTKTDFRANLRSRQNVLEEGTSREPEFKNIFGKLKRTQTQNYVAPDELKDNILKGKASLNLTGGPQKTKRVDEFKESILKKKESMKAEANLPRRNVTDAGGGGISPLQAIDPLPEALAKRGALNKRTEYSKARAVDSTPLAAQHISRPLAVKAETKKEPLLTDKLPLSDESSRPTKAMNAFLTSDPDTIKPRQLDHSSVEQTTLEGGKQTEPPKKPASRKSPVSPGEGSNLVAETISTGMDKKPAGKLAGRINPSLAGILSRGPPSTNSRSASTEDVSSTFNIVPDSLTDEARESSASPLIHATKARARGPKRRLPKAGTPPGKPEDSLGESRQMKELDELLQEKKANNASNDDISAGPRTPRKIQDATFSPRPLATLVNDNAKTPTVVAPDKPDSLLPGPIDKVALETGADVELDFDGKKRMKPVVAAKSPSLRKVSSPSSTNVKVDISPDPKLSPLEARQSARAKPDVQKEQDKSDGKVEDVQVSHSAKPKPRKPSASIISNSPPKSDLIQRQVLPTPQANTDIGETSNPIRKPVLRGLGLKVVDSPVFQPPSSQLTPPPEERLVQPLSSQESSSMVAHTNSSQIQERATPQQPSVDASELMADFFDEKPKTSDKIEVDTQAIILNRPSFDSKSKVLSMRVWQINPDGKKENLPPQQEHILFEDYMYLCVHTFAARAATGSSATEVYLWSGDRVSEAAIEDAQLFCRKEARENNTRLELLRQGKEPPKFFQALGGIVIVRRSRNSSLYMLCGRRHLGHVAFDEVDLNASSLCSGFPYLISAKFGKLYLWKGKGSGADEVGCARLIGMDLGLTGEIEEVDEGNEPSGFLESFKGTMATQVSSQQWSLRSRSNKHGCRLFRVEMEQSRGMAAFWTRRGSSPAKATKANIQEIHPFCQRDLDSRSIFVLDSYFNLFVYVGVDAGSKPAEFVTALMFAQEYGILAASLEDRPFIPNCQILFYGAPLDFAIAFRKWEGVNGTKKLQERCRVIALNDALEALSSGSVRV